ncbi:tripartite tricarboxylate transporter TctB family protein [Blastococcus saxobsidens]|uniref:Tripartite tricarboxylate transporter TctB family protein n=1 Tax=Blastococcus saxobsidens TaxID=138336 RepID=A0A6L9W298_9ACTN|nr:tripartite tricarboxylate transporter TctB family protein [Blastococcus saxobsidens]NEK85942.1 tripartite tricarboxylate transporter TctB family protein [Blastococcus saxobsidens]
MSTAEPRRTASPVPTEEIGMAVPEQHESRRPSTGAVADVVLGLFMVAVFGWAFLEAADWSFKAALFPRIVTGLGFTVALLQVVQSLLRLARGRRAAADPTPATSPAGPIGPVPGAAPAEAVPQAAGTTSEDDVNEDDVEYVFQTAGARRWTEAVAWVTAFFVLLYVAGLFVTAPLFSFLYLRFAGRRTWVFCAIYAVVVGVVLYAAFELALGIPVPPGLFLD